MDKTPTPIYIKRGSISPIIVKQLYEVTKRPVVFTHGNPHEEILDSELSLRDYFAGQALAGLTSNQYYIKAVVDGEGENAPNKMAEISYELADAMMKEREK